MKGRHAKLTTELIQGLVVTLHIKIYIYIFALAFSSVERGAETKQGTIAADKNITDGTWNCVSLLGSQRC